MSIRQCMHVELSENLKDGFLNYVTSDNVDADVAENKKVKEDRKILEDKIERLHEARRELSKFLNLH